MSTGICLAYTGMNFIVLSLVAIGLLAGGILIVRSAKGRTTLLAMVVIAGGFLVAQQSAKPAGAATTTGCLTAYRVSNLNDSGSGSLRSAIVKANATGTASAITFSTTGVITLQSSLPSIASNIRIDGTTAPGYDPPTVGINANGYGSFVFNTGSTGSALLGLAIYNAAGNGVTLNAGGITLDGNFIGITTSEQTSPNSGNGIYIAATSSGNFIGTTPSTATSFAVANVISGNTLNGIDIAGSANNTIVSNRIGTNYAGTAAIPNQQNGILITAQASGNTIGGTAIGIDAANGLQNNITGSNGTSKEPLGSTYGYAVPPQGNQISGNGQNGVLVNGLSSKTTFEGNFVGTDATGNNKLGNANDGVWIDNALDTTLQGCLTSQNPFVYLNVLSGNGNNGLELTDALRVNVWANFFGLPANNGVTSGAGITSNYNTTYDVGNGNDGVLLNGNSNSVLMGGEIPMGNGVGYNQGNGVEVAGTAYNFTTFNTFSGITAFGPAAPNQKDGVLITSTGGSSTFPDIIRTSIISGNVGNGIELSGGANNVLVDPDIIGMNSNGSTSAPAYGTIGFGNLGDGILVTGNAHDNQIGGTLCSVVLQNVVSGNQGWGIDLTGNSTRTTIENTYIGSDLLGTSGTNLNASPPVVASNGLGGLKIGIGSSYNTVGVNSVANVNPGPDCAGYTNFSLANLISGNGSATNPAPGIQILGEHNTVTNTQVGTGIYGEASDPTLQNWGDGMVIDGDYNTIGGAATCANGYASPATNYCNVFSNNHLFGIVINSQGNVVTYNVIGLNAATTLPLPNGSGDIGGTEASSANNTVGPNFIYN